MFSKVIENRMSLSNTAYRNSVGAGQVRTMAWNQGNHSLVSEPHRWWVRREQIESTGESGL